MDFINDIEKETIFICSDYVKKHILKLNILKPIKIMSFDEFKRKYLYSYDEAAVLFVMNEYNLKYDVAREYIENTYYVCDKFYGVSKLDFLVELKKKLDNQNLLSYNEYFREYAKRVKIIIYDMIISEYTKRIFDGLDYQLIMARDMDYSHQVLEFDSAYDEVRYVSYEIADLIHRGVDINKIKLTNVGKEYYSIIARVFALYGIPVNIPYKSSLASYKLVATFIERLRNGDTIELILNDIKCDDDIYRELVKVINKYLKYDNKELIIYQLEHSYISSKAYVKAVNIVDYLDYISLDDEYIFMLNFNEGAIPKNYLDTEYITDNIAKYVGIKTTRELNMIIRDMTIKKIKSIKNLVITYKKYDTQKTYYPSTLCDKFEVVRGNFVDNISYSTLDDSIRLVSQYDNYFKYGSKGWQFDTLNHNYKIKYNSYDNHFKGITRDSDNLYLSYSKMNLYNKCSFRYYLANILKLDIFEENFSAIIGSMVHYVMEKVLSTHEYLIDDYINEFLGKYQLNKKELFFLEKYKKAINRLIEQVMLEEKLTCLDLAMFEKKIEIAIDDRTKFVGIIDKLKYMVEDDKTYVALIDYKTGNDDISLNYLNDGLNMQLPIYLYLASKLDFEKIIFVGFYLQKLNLTNDDYRLEGYSNSDVDILQKIDCEYDNSRIIKGLKTNKDGSFSRYSKLISNEEILELLKIVDRQIRNTANNIHHNKFMINPKVTNLKNIGCEYCKFKDICFKTKNDEVLIQESSFGE